ncbi:hypothetical protein [Flavobacterium ginsenosidimutans]|uniref:HNH nuclease domain-containing protein n=1 Tax=Flavobacterium ginsenosidimutans TaxID=687844 RepID=A0ABZ2Q6Z4_9FLAO
MLEHLVCQVWCNASNDITCSNLLDRKFEIIYNAYSWLKIDVDVIYEKCKDLTDDDRADIREAFFVNNSISELCKGTLKPIELVDLPDVVTTHMTSLLKKFYTPLLDRSEVSGDKLEYYNALVGEKYKTCPCCGLVKMESAESYYREDNDHFFPISKYPFASVNFRNLIPVCEKCNKKRKGTKTPQEHNGVAYYGFEARNDIEVSVEIKNSPTLNYSKLQKEDVEFKFSEDPEKNKTWDYLFGIKERYNIEVRDFSFTELRAIKNRIYMNKEINNGNSYDTVLNFEIMNYELDKYNESKFLKVAFLKEMKNKPEWMAVYNKH